jgi:hypothetical protein
MVKAIVVALTLLLGYGEVAEASKNFKGKGRASRGGTPAAGSSSGPDGGVAVPALPVCTHWAAPANATPAGVSGNPGTSAAPFRPLDFWTIAGGPQAKVLCLKNGEYTGSAYMINPPDGLDGTQLSPIIVRAENDGQATINGQFANYPVTFVSNSFYTVMGINAKNGTYAVIRNEGASNNNTIKRIVAWDMNFTLNGYTVWNTDSSNFVAEDVMAFGPGVGAFGNGFTASATFTCRRCWGRGEGTSTFWSHQEVFGMGYTNSVTKCENCFFTASGLSIPTSGYTITDADGNVATGSTSCRSAGTSTTWPCITALYRIRSDGTALPVGHTLLGSMGYLLASTINYPGTLGVYFPQSGWPVKDAAIRHVAVYASPSFPNFSAFRGFDIGSAAPSNATGNSLDRITSVRNVADRYNVLAVTPWTIGNKVEGTSFSAVSTANPWTGTVGAQFCYLSENGVVQDGTGGTQQKKLWPLPMNDRLLAVNAGAYAGPCRGTNGALGSCSGFTARPLTNVTSDIEGLLSPQFGAIPTTCKG